MRDLINLFAISLPFRLIYLVSRPSKIDIRASCALIPERLFNDSAARMRGCPEFFPIELSCDAKFNIYPHFRHYRRPLAVCGCNFGNRFVPYTNTWAAHKPFGAFWAQCLASRFNYI